MKQLNILACGALVLLAMASCELKEEMSGGGSGSSAGYGALELNVAVKQPATTKADNTVAADDDFAVTITATEVAQDAEEAEVWSYTVGTLPEDIILPTGTYTVAAHTPGDIEKQMTAPYYGAEQSLTITADVTSEVDVVCTMQNSRIEVEYTDEFKQEFSSWTIVIDDGSDLTYTFTNEDLDDVVYWYFAEGTTSVTVNVIAKTDDGKTVHDQRTFTKSNADSGYESGVSDDFSGGDALDIIMGFTESESGYASGIDIQVNITFEENDETVTIPTLDVTDNGEGEGGEGDDNQGDDNQDETSDEITISDGGTNYLTNGVYYTIGNAYPTDVTLNMTVDNGIQNMYVVLSTDNEEFGKAASDLGLSSGDGIDLVSSSAAGLSALFTLPEVGGTSYSFSLTETLWSMLAFYGEGTHSFTLTVVDQEGNRSAATLTLHITA